MVDARHQKSRADRRSPGETRIANGPNRFGAVWGEYPDLTVGFAIWHFIDTVLPVIFVVQAIRLWWDPST